MIYDSPKSTEKIVWGVKHALSPLPKFAKRLGAALTGAASVTLKRIARVVTRNFIGKEY